METILIESGYYSHLFNDDPVRPHLTEEFRLSNNRLGLALIDNHICKAAVCIAISNKVPTNEIELDEFSSDKTKIEKSIAIFYLISILIKWTLNLHYLSYL